MFLIYLFKSALPKPTHRLHLMFDNKLKHLRSTPSSLYRTIRWCRSTYWPIGSDPLEESQFTATGCRRLLQRIRIKPKRHRLYRRCRCCRLLLWINLLFKIIKTLFLGFRIFGVVIIIDRDCLCQGFKADEVLELQECVGLHLFMLVSFELLNSLVAMKVLSLSSFSFSLSSSNVHNVLYDQGRLQNQSWN